MKLLRKLKCKMFGHKWNKGEKIFCKGIPMWRWYWRECGDAKTVIYEKETTNKE